jgi:hypothetical protein
MQNFTIHDRNTPVISQLHPHDAPIHHELPPHRQSCPPGMPHRYCSPTPAQRVCRGSLRQDQALPSSPTPGTHPHSTNSSWRCSLGRVAEKLDKQTNELMRRLSTNPRMCTSFSRLSDRPKPRTTNKQTIGVEADSSAL